MSGVVKLKAARAVADLSQGTIIAMVEIAAPPERVFRAISDPNEIVKWWGSDQVYRTTEATADFRVGGSWRSAGKGADGRPFAVEGEYLEIESPRRIVQTWRPDWDAGQTSTLRYTLDAIPGGTRLTVRHEGFAGRPESCEGHTSGWEMVLGWLEHHVSGAQPGAAPSDSRYFLCKLIPPRTNFPANITPAEGKAMNEHVAYWTQLAEEGVAIVFGPVVDPAGNWGVGIVRARDEDAIRALQKVDPAIQSGLGFKFETYAMPQAVMRG